MVLASCAELGDFKEEIRLSEADRKNIRENVQRNVLRTALDNPQVTFYLFFPPYSICYWDALVRTKQLGAQLDAEEMAVELLLQADNIRIFAFGDNLGLAEDLDNYTDALHYGEWVNSDILRWIKEGEYELRADDYEAYYSRIRKLYTEYDYSWLWE